MYDKVGKIEFGRAGGTAFPHPGGSSDATVQESHLGMTLRDWFAGQAIQAIIANNFRTGIAKELSSYASDAYTLADAMLKERER